MPTKTTEAVILSRKDFGEADRLITAFSKDEGKIKILAKGSRRLKSKMAAHIEPFSYGKYFLASGKTFYILAGAESESANQDNINTIEGYKAASYICEILDLATKEGEAYPGLYGLTRQILKSLPEIPKEKKLLVTHFFEFSLLSSLGYIPNYRVCKKCHIEIPETESYYGNFEGILCPDCGNEGRKISKNTYKILRLFSTGSISQVLKIKGAEDYTADLREVILPSLYDILPRIPKSNDL